MLAPNSIMKHSVTNRTKFLTELFSKLQRKYGVLINYLWEYIHILIGLVLFCRLQVEHHDSLVQHLVTEAWTRLERYMTNFINATTTVRVW